MYNIIKGGFKCKNVSIYRCDAPIYFSCLYPIQDNGKLKC